LTFNFLHIFSGFAIIENVLEAPAACGYSLTQGHGRNILVVDYTGCHVTLEVLKLWKQFCFWS